MNNNNELDQILNFLKKNQLNEAFELCNKNHNKQIEHIILNFKGAIYFKQQNYELAKNNFLKSIERKENFIDPYKNLYLLSLKCEDFADAVKFAEEVIKIEKLKNPESYYKLAYACELNGNYNDAINFYKNSESLGFADKKSLYNNLGVVYLKVNNTNESEKYLLKALEDNKNDKIIINNLLRCYLHSRNQDKAEVYYNKAEQINSKDDSFIYNKAEFLIAINKFEESINILKKITEDKNNFVAPLRLASLYSKLGKNIEAEELIDSALKKYPKNTLLKYSKGRMLIKKGDFKEGWNFFEYRKSKLNEQYPSISEWKGEIITSKKILVYNEQGIGDAIQFSKYLFALSKKCKIIDFVLDDKLYLIFKKNFQNINVLKKSEIVIKEYDYKISLGSLIKFFYNESDLNKNNLLHVNELKIDEWKNKFDFSKLNVGIIWSGFFLGPNEPHRSIPLEKFDKILSLDANFYALQKEVWDRDTIYLKNSNIINYGNLNLDEILAIISNLDLIISIDTSLLHMSYTLNKETWGLLSINSDYRWGKLYELDPHKSLKIYQQLTFDNWDSALNNIKEDLVKKINNFK